MSLIEGIGDEVVLFFVVVLIFIISALVTLIGNVPTLHNNRIRRQSNVREPLSLFQNSRIIIQRVGNIRASTSNSISRQESVNDVTSNNTPENNVGNNCEGTSNISAEQTNEEASTNNQTVRSRETIRTEADGSTVEDVTPIRDERTEADGSAIDDSCDSPSNEDSEHLHSPTPSAPSPESDEINETREIPEPGPGEIRVRLKYLDDTERIVLTSFNTKIEDFKKEHFRADIQNNKIVRLIFAGRLLHNNSTIQHCRIVDNSVVHVQVLPAPTAQTPPVATQDTDLDVGRLLWPLVTVILGLCWVTYLKYPEFYNSLSMGILMLFSGCFFYFLSRH